MSLLGRQRPPRTESDEAGEVDVKIWPIHDPVIERTANLGEFPVVKN